MWSDTLVSNVVPEVGGQSLVFAPIERHHVPCQRRPSALWVVVLEPQLSQLLFTLASPTVGVLCQHADMANLGEDATRVDTLVAQ